MRINKKIFIMISAVLIVFLIGYALIPKKYDTVHEIYSADGILMGGGRCECLGFKNKPEKTCIGVLYDCRLVK